MVEHLDRDSLALLALGEPAERASTTHLEGCPPCAGELESFRHIVARARAADPADLDLPAPPVAVWEQVHQRSTDEADPASTTPDDTDLPAPTPLSAARRRHRAWWLSAAAALAAVVAIGGGALLASDPDPPPLVLAVAELEPLDERADPLAARVVADDAGVSLEVDEAVLPESDGYYEVWLIDEAVDGMVSLGPLQPGGRHRVPDGLDLGAFPILDVSVEPFDGDPAHSGDSLLRAQLDV